jgi:serine protease
MSVIRRVALTLAAASVSVLAGALAVSASSAGGIGAGTGRAVIMVATPTLPSGDSAEARSRWREARRRSRAILEGVAERGELALRSSMPEIGQLSVELPSGGLAALRRRLAGDPRVEAVRPDVPVQLRYSPDDYAFVNPDPHAPNGDLGQWNLIREGGPRAWDLSRGNGAEVAMIDTGVDGGHPDLSPRISGATAYGTVSPLTDPVGHGTHTAGTACATAGNAYGIASLGFACSLFVAKIQSDGPCSNVSSALIDAANRRSAVINMSLGGCDSALVPALNYAQSRGSVLVGAADNTPSPSGSCGLLLGNDCLYPEEWLQPSGTGPNASFDRGLVVTSAAYDGSRSSFAESTTRVSVAGYGSATNAIGGQQGILSTWPANAAEDDSFGGRTSLNGDTRFAYLVGTSMATPQVAAVAALMRAVRPSLANTRVVHLIKATASQCGTYGGGIGWGIVRADEAVAAALNKDIDPPSSRVRRAKRAKRRAAGGRRRGRVIKLRLKRFDSRASRCVNDLPISGVKKVVLFASANGGRYHRIGKTKKAVFAFHAKRHRRYRFYSVAVDNAGNRETPPPIADAKARVR